jgi:O-Antigen ligase
MSYLISISLMGCICINVLSLNYLVGGMVGLPGQMVTGITAILLLLIIAADIIQNPAKVIELKIPTFTTLVVVAIPFVGYALNYHGQTLAGFLFWANRAIVVIFILYAGIILTTRISHHNLTVLSEILFLISCVSAISSYFYPYEALMLFTAGDQIWGDLEDASVDRAFGSTLSATDAGFSVIAFYLAHVLVKEKYATNMNFVHLIILDILLIVTVLLTGSRSAFLVAAPMVVFHAFFGRRTESIYMKVGPLSGAISRVEYLFYLMLALSIGFFIFSDFATLNPVDRILYSFQGSSQEDSSVSSDLRFRALEKGISLVLENPFFGVGFEDINTLMDLLPHNMFVYYAAINGIVLGVLYVVFICFVCNQIAKAGHLSQSISLALFLIVVSFFSHTIFGNKQLPWLLVAATYLASAERSDQSYLKKRRLHRRSELEL